MTPPRFSRLGKLTAELKLGSLVDAGSRGANLWSGNLLLVCLADVNVVGEPFDSIGAARTVVLVELELVALEK